MPKRTADMFALIIALGQDLRRRREALKMTQQELSKRSGLSSNYIGTIENGQRDPSFTSLVRLAQGLGIKITELFASRPDLSSTAEDLAYIYDEQPTEVKDAVAALVYAVKKSAKERKAETANPIAKQKRG